MPGLIPFNRRRSNDDFYNMLDDFFNESWLPGRNLMRDTFKIDVRENENEYLIDAELPGVEKEEIDLSFTDDCLTISVKREESVNDEGKNYIHRERRMSSMARNIRLHNAKTADVKAKLDNGVLSINVPKMNDVGSSHRINID